MEAGAVLDSGAYVVPEDYGIDTLKIIASQKAEIESLRALLDETDRLFDELRNAYEEADKARLEEREAWENAIAILNRDLAKAKRKRYFSVGPVVSYDGEVRSGFGLMYNMISF